MISSPLLIPLLAAVFLAVNMGGSGAAVAFSPAYGANLIRRDLIPGAFGVFVLLGALVAGSDVTETIGRGIVPESKMTIPVVSIVLLSIGISLLVANLLNVPQSTSQSTVAALLGVGVSLGDMQLGFLLSYILPAWVIMPLLAYGSTHLLGEFIYRPLNKRGAVNFTGLSKHPVLKAAVLGTSAYVAFSIGANNVANASGPIMSMLGPLVGADGGVLPLLIATMLVAPWFAFGASLFSSSVVEATGKGILRFGPLGATAVAFVTGSLLLAASLAGIPAALAQLNVGAIIGLGSYKHGPRTMLGTRAVRRVFTVWVVAPIIAFLLALLLYRGASVFLL
jgi:sulfate permease